MRLLALLAFLLAAGPFLASPAAAQFAVVEGTVDWPEETRLTRETLVEVTISDIGRGPLGARELARQILAPSTRPLPFRLAVDPVLAPRGGQYRVSARLLAGRNTLFEGSQDLRLDPVVDLGNLALFLENPVLQDTREASPLNRQWRLEDLIKFSLPPVAVVLMEIDDVGQVKGDTGCNLFQSRATLTAETLSFAPPRLTRRGCTPALATAEQRFLRVLRGTRTWQIRDRVLTLFDGSGLPLATFRDDF
ncbi:MAG: META domain-containing protein [Pseudomonadota bacterium]